MPFKLFEVLPCFNCSYFVSSWNQVGVFLLKTEPDPCNGFISQIHHEHRDPNEEISVQKTSGKQNT
jgi:hypothetical protein